MYYSIDRDLRKKDNKLVNLIVISFLFIFLIWLAIVESWHLIFCIICLSLLIVTYFSFDKIQKIRESMPTSLWKVYSKRYPIIIQYNPPRWINPAEAWLLYNRSVEVTDLTSLIYQWKFEKLIDIKTFKWNNSKKDYIKLIKLDDMPLTRPFFESEIFDSIFALSDVKIIEWPFQLRYALMLEDLEYHWIQKWWLYKNENKVKKFNFGKIKFWWLWYFIWLYFFSRVLTYISDSLIDLDNITFVQLLRFIVIFFLIVIWFVIIFWKLDWWSELMFTDKWAKLASHVIGYRNFIKSCDENKIKLLLKEDPLFIDRTLPYATAFWMETEFLKKVSPLKSDWNAKYYKGTKVPSLGILRYLLRDDDSLL